MKHYPIKPIIIVVTTLAVSALIYFVATHNLLNYALDKASTSTGRSVTASNEISIDWGWPVTGVHMSNVKLSNFDKGTQPDMFSADKLFVSINLFSLLKFDVNLPEITLDNPNLLLEKTADGDANWKLLDNASGGASTEIVTPDDRSDIPEIGRLLIKNGHITYLDAEKNTNVKLNVETISGSAKEDEQLHFTGTGEYLKQVFKLDITGGSVFQLKDNDKPYPINIDMQVGTTSAKLTGTMLDPVQFKGMDTELMIKGADASELFTIVAIALPPTPPYEVKGNLTYEDNVWKFQNFKGKMGNSDLSGNVTWDTTKERPLLSGDFVSNKLNFEDLGGFVGAKTAVKREDSSAKQLREAEQAEASPYLIPETPLDISRLSSMDAKVTFTGKKLISDSLPLDDFYLNVYLDNSLLKLQPLRFGTASGDIEAFMTVNARNEPVKIDGDFNFKRLSLKPIFESLSKTLGKPNYADGYIGGTAKLAGTGKSLREMLATSKGDVGLGMEGGHLSNLIVELLGLDVAEGLGFFVSGDQPVPVRCVIGDFGVSDGLMQVRQFVIDTNDSNIRGKGTINLKNEELNLTLRTYAKDNTLVSLNSPIRLTGTMKSPSINLNVANIAARGAVAAAASVIAAPVALIAFVEKGLGKDSPCNALVKEMNKNTGKSSKENLIPKNKK
jgi:AsmA family protein